MFINKVLFALTVLLELLLFVLASYHFKGSSTDKTDVFVMLLIYIIFAFPSIISFVTMTMAKSELTACLRYVKDDVSDEELEEAESIIDKARDINFSELSVLVIAFVFYVLSVM